MFQFTHPGKGATTRVLEHTLHVADVSIHAPWEGCDAVVFEATDSAVVSIHAPWEGCDTAGIYPT